MRVSGIARGGNAGTVLEQTTVFTGKTQIASFEQLDPFELETDDGRRVRVELAKSLRLEPAEKRDVRWKEIEDDASLARLHVKNAPGPHVKVRLVRTRVLEGARVEILAQDEAEHVFAITASHRAAPERRVSSITARAIATGDGAAAIIDRLVAPKAATAPSPKAKKARRGKAAQRQIVAPILAALGVPFLALAALMKLSPLSVDFALGGAGLFATAAMVWLMGRVPRFVRGGRAVGKLGDPEHGFMFLVYAMLPLTMMVVGMFFDHATPWQDPHSPYAYNASWGNALLLAVLGVVFVVGAVRGGRAEARLFRVLLSAPQLPAEGALDRTWGAFEGVVRDPTPVTAEGEAVAIVHVVSEEIVEGSNPNIYTERILSKGTFFVDGPGGQSLEVHPDDAVWASNVGLRVQKKQGSKTIVEHLRAVPLRGSILLAGRVERAAGDKAGRVAASGAESLLFVAVREGENARIECRAVLFLRRLAVVVALAAIGIAAAAVMFAEPRLPKFHIPSDGD